jgi:hypothetical protein
MTLGTSNIIQTNQGSTGASNASSVTATLPAATAAGNQIILAVTSNKGLVNGVGTVLLLPTPFSDDGSVDNQSPAPHLLFGSKDSTAGETSWTVQLKKYDGTAAAPDALCWFVAEVSGLHAHPARDPNTGCGAAGFSASTKLVINNSGIDGVADELCLAFFANHINSGTPKTVSSVANTATQPGTWARLGATAATTNASGANVRLDVFRKFPNAVGKRDATATFSASVTGASGLVDAYTS